MPHVGVTAQECIDDAQIDIIQKPSSSPTSVCLMPHFMMAQDCEHGERSPQWQYPPGQHVRSTGGAVVGDESFVLPPLQLGMPQHDACSSASHFTSAQDYGFGDPTPPLVYPRDSAIGTMVTPSSTAAGGLLCVFPSALQVVVGTTTRDDEVTDPPPLLSRRSSFRQEGSSRRNSISLEKGELVEITLPPSKQGERHRSVVRQTSLTFKETAIVAIIKPAKSLSRKADLWFQESEMKLFRKQVNALVQLTDNGYDSESGKKYCMRGLERLMQPHTALRQRGVAWDSVLKEQNLQRKLGLFNEEDMANLYKFSTMISRHEAVERAQEDAKEAAMYLASARRRCRQMSM